MLHGLAFVGSFTLFGLIFGAIGAFQACAMTALNLVTPNEMRGSGVAVFSTIAGIVGGSAGPVLVASAGNLGGQSSIGLGLAVVIGVCCPLCALFLFLGMRPMRAAMAEAESATV